MATVVLFQPIFIQVMEKSLVTEKCLINLVMTETNVLRTLQHPCIIRLHQSFQSSDQLFFMYAALKARVRLQASTTAAHISKIEALV